MSVLLDIIGSIIIGGVLLLMLVTFQYQLHDSAERFLYMGDMVEHTDKAATKLNKVIALAGVGFTPATAVTYATLDSLVFQTYWNYQTDCLTLTPVTLSIKLAQLTSPVGKALVIRQNGVPLDDMGNIFWVNDLKFKYYDKYDVLTTNKVNVRSAELWLTFMRSSPTSGEDNLLNKIQIKCYFMNAYMQGA